MRTVAAYSDELPAYCKKLVHIRIMPAGGGMYRVQYLHYGILWNRWRTVTDTHPGYGGTIELMTLEYAVKFHEKVRERLTRRCHEIHD